MTKPKIDLETMMRIDRTASLVRDTVQQTFTRLQYYLLATPDPAMAEDLGVPLESLNESVNTRIEAISLMARQLLKGLFCMCELIMRHSDPTPEARARFAKILGHRRDVDDGYVIDLHVQRLRRLPINNALEIVLSDLEMSCEEISHRVCLVAERRSSETVNLTGPCRREASHD